jgi:anti-sigma regulatory factor (Ser/Thr protein kinase)
MRSPVFEASRFQPELESVTSSRRWIAGRLDGRVAPSVVQDAQLCTSELAANAVRHAATPFRIQLEQQGSVVRVTVHDDDPSHPIPTDADPSCTSGRGLFIVDAVAAAWGWTRDPHDGKDVWFELSTDRS